MSLLKKCGITTRVIFDPRFTLSVYLVEIKRQMCENAATRSSDEIVLPFSWTDWVDLTMLNDELIKPEKNLVRIFESHSRFIIQVSLLLHQQ